MTYVPLFELQPYPCQLKHLWTQPRSQHQPHHMGCPQGSYINHKTERLSNLNMNNTNRADSLHGKRLKKKIERKDTTTVPLP